MLSFVEFSFLAGSGMTRFPRGSEWRKWRLHIHSPGTKPTDGYKCSDGQSEPDFFVIFFSTLMFRHLARVEKGFFSGITNDDVNRSRKTDADLYWPGRTGSLVPTQYLWRTVLMDLSKSDHCYANDQTVAIFLVHRITAPRDSLYSSS